MLNAIKIQSEEVEAAPEVPVIHPAIDVIDHRLLENHSHFLYGPIDEESIASALKWLMYENLKEEDKVLNLIINSEGGNLQDAFALIDMIRSSKHDVRTVGIGNVISSAFLIFVSGTKGLRTIAPNASILCHQYSDTIDGKHHDIKAYVKEAELANSRMIRLLRDVTDLDTGTVKRRLLSASDAWLTPEEMIGLKLADHIL